MFEAGGVLLICSVANILCDSNSPTTALPSLLLEYTYILALI